MQEAARAIGLQVRILNATTSREIDAVFATVERERLDALLVAGDHSSVARVCKIASLVARDRIPVVYGLREYVVAGGLMSYGTNFADQFHPVGFYTGSILKGANPAELPVLQPIRVRHQPEDRTAKALGLTIPPSLLAIADQVIG